MKLKNFKNYILTFIVCLLGSFAFNAVETKAANVQQIEGFFYANNGNVYRNNNVIDSNNSVTNTDSVYGYLSLNYYSSSYQVVWQDVQRDLYMFFTSCAYNTNSGILPPSVVGVMECSNVYALQNNNSGSFVPSTSSTKQFILNADNSVTMVFYSGNNYLYRVFRLYGDYNSGYEEGYEEGRHEGYDLGYDEGYDLGYDLGYEEGTDNQNTLVGMVGAVFTGPVSMFQEIFNFNVLGINFAEMLLGLVTLLVVIWLVKRFI